MKNPNILFTAPGVAELCDCEIPAPRAGEVLIRAERTAVSAGTERANLLGDPNISISAKGEVKFPRQVGYSAAGIVVAVGEGVTSLAVGDRVACSESKHARYFRLKEKYVYPLDDAIGFDTGALVRIATFPLAAIRKCHVEIGESAIVMGLGVLGLIGVSLLHAAGATPVIAVDPVPEKRARALEIGADYALDPFDPDFISEVKRLTNGGAKVALEITGKGQGLDMVLDVMARLGRVALLGCTRNSDFSIDYYRKVHGPGISLIGAHTAARPLVESAAGLWTERDDALAVLTLVKHGRLSLASLVEEVHPASDAAAVYTRLATEKSFPIVEFDWSGMRD